MELTSSKWLLGKMVLGLLKLSAAYTIITLCYLHFGFWDTISYFEADPSNVYDFIVGKYREFTSCETS